MGHGSYHGRICVHRNSCVWGIDIRVNHVNVILNCERWVRDIFAMCKYNSTICDVCIVYTDRCFIGRVVLFIVCAFVGPRQGVLLGQLHGPVLKTIIGPIRVLEITLVH